MSTITGIVGCSRAACDGDLGTVTVGESEVEQHEVGRLGVERPRRRRRRNRSCVRRSRSPPGRARGWMRSTRRPRPPTRCPARPSHYGPERARRGCDAVGDTTRSCRGGRQRRVCGGSSAGERGRSYDTSSSTKMHSPGQARAASITFDSNLFGTVTWQARPPGSLATRPRGLVADVGDAVVEEHEQLGTVVGAEAVAGAQILVDPDAHVSRPIHAPCPGCARPCVQDPASVARTQATRALRLGDHSAGDAGATVARSGLDRAGGEVVDVGVDDDRAAVTVE